MTDVQHHIDLVPGLVFLTNPIIECAQKSMNAININQRCIMCEHIEKCYVHESMSPCIMPVLLVSKK